MEELIIHNCGIVAIPKLHKTEAIITGCSIRYGKVQYELSYFHHGDYKSVWLHESEFTIPFDSQIKIGFK